MYKKEIKLRNCAFIDSDMLKEAKLQIPSQFRRRLSQASLFALSAALKLTSVTSNDHLSEMPDYIIFASQHGELDHMVNILESISHQALLSPIEFSLAVHNAASGVYSIIQKLPKPTTSIAAGSDTFMMALVEALSFLTEKPKAKILLVSFDQALPICYQNLNIRYDHAYACAFLIEGGTHTDTEKLSVLLEPFLESNDKNNQSNDSLSAVPAIEFYQWYQGVKGQLTEAKPLVQYGLRNKIVWQYGIND